ncbi:MAG: hypothetical protein R6V40_03620 [Candidatus Moraniibacteriota bacterium]
MFFTKDRTENLELDFRLNLKKKEDDIEQFFAFCNKLLENIETKLKFFDIESIKLKSEETKRHAIFLRSRIYMNLLGLSPFMEANKAIRDQLIKLDFKLNQIINNEENMPKQGMLNKFHQNQLKGEKEDVLHQSV